MPRRILWDRDQVPFRDGDEEFIRLRDGRRKTVRRWDAAARRWEFTSGTGRQFFATRVVEYVAQIPVVIRGTRRDGRGTYEKRTRLPVDLLGMGKLHVSAALADDEAHEHLKRRILQHVGYHEAESTAEALVIYRFSDEEYVYDPSGEWTLSSMTTEPRRDAAHVTEVVLDRPMRGLRAVPPDLLRPDLLIAEALDDDDGRCVPKQLAVVTGLSRSEVEGGLDRCAPTWRITGVTARQILAFCEERSLPCYVVYGGRLIRRHLPDNPRHSRGVAFACHDGHAFFYASTHAVSRLPVREAEVPPAAKLVREKRERKVDVSTWRPWAGQFEEPGVYYTKFIEDVRRQFLLRGLNPQVTLSSRTSIAALTLQLRALPRVEAAARPPGGQPAVRPAEGQEQEDDSSSSEVEAPHPLGSVVARHWPDHADEIQEWVRAVAERSGLSLIWQGEGLGEASVKVLRALLLQRQRVRPTAQMREEISQRQDGRCAVCGGICERDDREFDHVVPLRDSGEVQQFQMLCLSCHDTKTRLEPRCTRDPLASAFSRAAFEAYVESPRLPALTFVVHAQQQQAGEIMEVDARRCRRNALLCGAHAFPLFCALDSIVPFPAEPRLFDLQFIDAGPAPQRPAEAMRRLPYTGPRFYPRVAAEWLLHHGKVTWADFVWGFDAASHLPPDALAQPLELMEAAWRGAPDLPKKSINAALGILGAPRQTAYRLKSGDDIPEAQVGGAVRVETRFGAGERCVDWIWETRLLTNSSHRPIHDVACFTEHVRVAQAYYVLTRLRVPPRNVLCVRTDAVVFQASTRLARAVQLQLESLTFRDLGGLRGLYEPPLFAEERRRREQIKVTAADSDAQVFRVRPAKVEAAHRMPSSDAKSFQQAMQPEDIDEERARAITHEGKSLLILGPPGTGKTFLMKQLVADLRAAGRRVVVIAKTHCAVQNASGDHTANHFCHKYVLHGSTSAHCVVVEEISQVDVALWCDLARLQFLGKQWILLGDHEQFGPIGNQWRGTPVPDEALERSSLLRELCPYRLTLTQNIRSDPPLFDWYTSLMRGGARREAPMEDLLAEARRAFPRTAREADYTLCLSHRKRIAVNGRMNLLARRRHPEAVLVKAQPCPFDLNKPQDFWCYPGQQLIGCCRQGSVVRNGCLYIVKEATEARVALEEGPVLTLAQAGRALRLTHALTQAGCQGLTLPGVVRIVETSSPRFTRRHLYVCLSRATAFNLVEVL